MMENITIKINGKEFPMKKGITILDASFETQKYAKEYNIRKSQPYIT